MNTAYVTGRARPERSPATATLRLSGSRPGHGDHQRARGDTDPRSGLTYDCALTSTGSPIRTSGSWTTSAIPPDPLGDGATSGVLDLGEDVDLHVQDRALRRDHPQHSHGHWQVVAGHQADKLTTR